MIHKNRSQNVNCKIHGKEFITIDTSNFKLSCSKCQENGEKDAYLEVTEKQINDDLEEEIECEKHPNLQGNFYCNDCKIFLCKFCFANEHRTHKSNLPEEISTIYKSELKKLINDISSIKPRIDDSLKSISEIDKKIKSIRETSLNKMKMLFLQINLTLKEKYEIILKQYDSSFEGIDEEVSNLHKRMESLQKKSFKYSLEIQDFLSFLNNNSSKSTQELCNLKKGKKELMKEARKLIEDSESFFSLKIANTKQKYQNKMEMFNKQIEKFLKHLQIYEKSVLNSIHTGISSSSLRLRRFNKFSKNNFKFYKTSSIVCQVNKVICLVGLGFCGLNSKDKSITEISQKNSNVPISVEISYANSENSLNSERPKLTKETHYLNFIQNQNDPTIVVYFHKAIILKPNVKYLLTVINEHKDSFLELWCGEVAKVFLTKMMQFVHCNTSGVHFEFYPSQGVESDFNEFNIGLIADLIFSVTG